MREDSRVESIGSALVLQSTANSYNLRFTVLIDGKPAGTISRGDCKRYPLAPGDHNLTVHIGAGGDHAWSRSRWMDWLYNRYYSRRLSFVVKTDEDCESICGSNPMTSKKIVLTGSLICGAGIAALGEIQNALFPQYRFGLGTPLDAIIFALLVGSASTLGRLVVYWPDGLVWCKLK